MLEEINLSRKIKKQELLTILKKECSGIDIYDLIAYYVHLCHEGRYLPENYFKDYLKAYVMGFIIRIKEIKDNSEFYDGYVDQEELKKALNLLNRQEDNVKKIRRYPRSFKIYALISIYTTFILDEPIHMVGTLFPGGFRVKYEDNIYYCPVKDGQKDNPHAVCAFCIALQDEAV